jgi:hypothetical protein
MIKKVRAKLYLLVTVMVLVTALAIPSAPVRASTTAIVQAYPGASSYLFEIYINGGALRRGGYCADVNKSIAYYTPHFDTVIYDYYAETLPSSISNLDWPRITYLVNNVPFGTMASDVNYAIWYFTNNGRDPMEQASGYPAPTAMALTLKNNAVANGAYYTPPVGAWKPMICIFTEPDIQLVFYMEQVTVLIPPIFTAAPAIDIEKYVSNDGGTTWLDADAAPGPSLNSGTNPHFKYVATNKGNVSLNNVSIVDSDFSLVACIVPSTLEVGSSFECTISPSWQEGQHVNTATAYGSYEGTVYSDTDDANYLGVTSNPEPEPEVGGDIFPVDKFVMLVPAIVLAVVLLSGIVVLKRRNIRVK